MTDLTVGNLVPTMVSKATSIAAGEWSSIKDTAVHEFQVLAHRIVEIAVAYENHTLKKETAIKLFAMAKNHLIATIALLNTMVIMTAQKIVDAAVDAIRQLVNAKLGFALI